MKGSKLVTTQKGNDFVKSVIPNLKDTTAVKLLYRGSRDGWYAYDFHRFCDNQGPTVTIARSNAGRVFGGYASVSWTSRGKYKADEKAVIFSIDSEAKYPCLQLEEALYHKKRQGPSFGGECLSIAMN